MAKLSAAMERAKGKLTNEWQSPYRLGESRATLDALERRGLAESRRREPGHMFFPTIKSSYRLKG